MEVSSLMQVSSFEVLYDGKAIANSTRQLILAADGSGGPPVTASIIPALQSFTVAGSEVRLISLDVKAWLDRIALAYWFLQILPLSTAYAAARRCLFLHIACNSSKGSWVLQPYKQ